MFRRSANRSQDCCRRGDYFVHSYRSLCQEMSDNEIVAALEARTNRCCAVAELKLWTRAEKLPVYREKIVVALASNHALLKNAQLNWTSLEEEMILIQGATRGTTSANSLRR